METYNNNDYNPETQQQEYASVQAQYSVEPEGAKKKKKRSKTWLKITALALVCAIIGAAAGVGGFAWYDSMRREQAMNERESSIVLKGNRETQELDYAEIAAGKAMTASEVYVANVNSTVGITTAITTNFFGYQTTSAASGSGFIMSEDGYILTNHHVIEGSSSVTVSLYDGTSYDATVIGYDKNNDIAVLKVDAEGLVPVVFGNSDDVKVGENVIAIGNPLGELTFSLTSGVVSALDREVTLSSGVTMDLIQTDCAINSGNSGGALFNLYGEVVGITNAKYSSSSSGASIDNIGFAIPVNNVLGIIESIIEKGYISKPYIGISIVTVTNDAIALGLPAGAAVQSVGEGSPAEAAGLQANDIITKANDIEIKQNSDLTELVGSMAVGDKLKLSIYRQGQILELEITVGEQVQSALEAEAAPSAQQQPGMGGLFPWGFGG